MTKNLILAALLCLVMRAAASAESTEVRVWRTSDGRQTVRAVAVEARYDRKLKTTLIALERPDGTTLTIPYVMLDGQSREYAWYNVQRRRAKESGRPFSLPPPGTVKFAERFSPVAAKDIPDTAIKKGSNVLLAIAPRIHELGRPPEGWCGEVAIQEAMLYHGVYYPQEKINEAGKPVHPDLYANDIPKALANLSMKYRYGPGESADVGDFIAWIRKQIAAGVPVLVGVKIYPTSHEEWGLDHFVLAVGVEGDSLVLNTTWGLRYTLTERQLSSTQKGFSFANRYNSHYGISIEGPRGAHADDRPVRVFVRKETADQLAVIVKCEDLQPGVEYYLNRVLGDADVKDPKAQITFKATQRTYAVHDTIPRRSPVIYHCHKTLR